MNFPHLTRSDGRRIPLPSFGTGIAWYKGNPDEPDNHDLIGIVRWALSKGLIHLDCADSHGTECEVSKAIRDSDVVRNQLFITTKAQDGWADVPAAMDKSLESLHLEYVDLYLLHKTYIISTTQDLHKAWKDLEGLKASGKARTIGVSNMQRHHIETILEVAAEVPCINQIEFHPYLQRAVTSADDNYIPWLQKKGIKVSSLKSLAPITVAKSGPLVRILENIAEVHGVTAGAVLLRWTMDKGVLQVTTIGKKERLDEYLAAVGLESTEEEREEITEVGRGYHFRWWGNGYFGEEDRSWFKGTTVLPGT